MTRPRAADDFTMIRARMEELRRERALPEELRRERAQILAEARGHSAIHPRPYYYPAANTRPSIKAGSTGIMPGEGEEAASG